MKDAGPSWNILDVAPWRSRFVTLRPHLCNSTWCIMHTPEITEMRHNARLINRVNILQRDGWCTRALSVSHRAAQTHLQTPSIDGVISCHQSYCRNATRWLKANWRELQRRRCRRQLKRAHPEFSSDETENSARMAPKGIRVHNNSLMPESSLIICFRVR